MKILYICTHNRCRSILSEAITNHIANGKIIARSAGSQPVGEVHPLSIKYLNECGISEEFVRLSIGIEDNHDLIEDLSQALKKVKT